MFTEDPQATVAFSPSPGALPRSAGEVFYAQTPLWTSLLAAFALKEQFSPTALLGVAAFTASLGVAACPDDVPRRGAVLTVLEGVLGRSHAMMVIECAFKPLERDADFRGAQVNAVFLYCGGKAEQRKEFSCNSILKFLFFSESFPHLIFLIRDSTSHSRVVSLRAVLAPGPDGADRHEEPGEPAAQRDRRREAVRAGAVPSLIPGMQRGAYSQFPCSDNPSGSPRRRPHV